MLEIYGSMEFCGKIREELAAISSLHSDFFKYCNVSPHEIWLMSLTIAEVALF